MDDKPIPVPGDVWRHGADERRGVIRDIEVDGSYKPGFVHATGVQSGRETRIRLVNGRLPSPWYRLSAAAPTARRADPGFVCATDCDLADHNNDED